MLTANKATSEPEGLKRNILHAVNKLKTLESLPLAAISNEN
jgi:hypothetical protein